VLFRSWEKLRSLMAHLIVPTLVIGLGVAGLRAALAACEHGNVIILSKAHHDCSNTAWAQGGIASVLSDADSFALHEHDTHVAGAGLCDEYAVRAIVRKGPEHLSELLRWGMRYDTDKSGCPALGREGAHTQARIVHADGDATGRELIRCLFDQVRKRDAIRIIDDSFVLDLLTPSNEPGSPVIGAISYHPRYGLQVFQATATVLASGGAGAIYRETSNPRLATGDGIAMAYRAGGTVSDAAFVQFHPTTLYIAGAPRALISEAVRGEGAHLIDADGYRFMLDDHELAELAPRDVVCRSILHRLRGTGHTNVYLDVRHLTGFSVRFPCINAMLLQYGLDPAIVPIPVNPAAHYTIGGIATDLAGRTNVPGLYAAGEVASTGFHGANRLASNSLLEGLVLGEAAGRSASRRTFANSRAPISVTSDLPSSNDGKLDIDDVLCSLRSTMWRDAGIERTGVRLSHAQNMIDLWAQYSLHRTFDTPAGWELQNMLFTSALVVRSALWRDESRGCHWRNDSPVHRERYCVHDEWRRWDSSPHEHPVDVYRQPSATA